MSAKREIPVTPELAEAFEQLRRLHASGAYRDPRRRIFPPPAPVLWDRPRPRKPRPTV